MSEFKMLLLVSLETKLDMRKGFFYIIHHLVFVLDWICWEKCTWIYLILTNNLKICSLAAAGPLVTV